MLTMSEGKTVWHLNVWILVPKATGNIGNWNASLTLYKLGTQPNYYKSYREVALKYLRSTSEAGAHIGSHNSMYYSCCGSHGVPPTAR